MNCFTFLLVAGLSFQTTPADTDTTVYGRVVPFGSLKVQTVDTIIVRGQLKEPGVEFFLESPMPILTDLFNKIDTLSDQNAKLQYEVLRLRREVFKNQKIRKRSKEDQALSGYWVGDSSNSYYINWYRGGLFLVWKSQRQDKVYAAVDVIYETVPYDQEMPVSEIWFHDIESDLRIELFYSYLEHAFPTMINRDSLSLPYIRAGIDDKWKRLDSREAYMARELAELITVLYVKGQLVPIKDLSDFFNSMSRVFKLYSSWKLEQLRIKQLERNREDSTAVTLVKPRWIFDFWYWLYEKDSSGVNAYYIGWTQRSWTRLSLYTCLKDNNGEGDGDWTEIGIQLDSSLTKVREIGYGWETWRKGGSFTRRHCTITLKDTAMILRTAEGKRKELGSDSLTMDIRKRVYVLSFRHATQKASQIPEIRDFFESLKALVIQNKTFVGWAERKKD